MAPFVGQSGVLMNLPETISAGLVRQGTLVEVDEGLSPEELASIVQERFGVSPTDSVAEATPKASTTVEKPRGNASRDDWVAYALSQGKSEDDLAGLKQGEIRELLEPADPATSETGSTESEDGDQGDGTNPDETE